MFSQRVIFSTFIPGIFSKSLKSRVATENPKEIHVAPIIMQSSSLFLPSWPKPLRRSSQRLCRTDTSGKPQSKRKMGVNSSLLTILWSMRKRDVVDARLERLRSLSIQHFPDFSCQPLQGQRFLDVIDSFFQDSMTNNRLVGIA